MNQIKVLVCCLTLALVCLTAAAQRRDHFSVELAGSLERHGFMAGVNATYSPLSLEKLNLGVGVGFHYAYASVVLTEGKESRVLIANREGIIPVFARVQYRFRPFFLSLDAGYHFNVVASSNIVGSKPTPVVSGFFFSPAVGIDFARRFYLTAGVQWFQKTSATWFTDTIDGMDAYGIKIGKSFVPSARLTLGVRF